jgi:hypothetical protein
MRYSAAAVALIVSSVSIAPQACADTFDELRCIYKSVPVQTRELAARIYLDPEHVSRADVEPSLAGVRETCGQKYGWSAEQHSVAYEATLYMSYIDVLFAKLDAMKLDYGVIRNVAARLLDVDKTPFLDRRDSALDARLRSELMARGVKDEEALHLAVDMIWALHNHVHLTEAWETKWPSFPENIPRPAAPTLPKPRVPASPR